MCFFLECLVSTSFCLRCSFGGRLLERVPRHSFGLELPCLTGGLQAILRVCVSVGAWDGWFDSYYPWPQGLDFDK